MATIILSDVARRLQMSKEVVARRSHLSLETVEAILNQSAAVEPSQVKLVRACLGLTADGYRLVPNKTFRKHVARKKTHFVMSVVQGTMSLEAQGLDPQGYRDLFESTYARFKSNPRAIW